MTTTPAPAIRRVYLSRPLILALVGMFVSVAAMFAGTLVYVNHVAQKQCALMSTLDETYRATPPTTPTGRKVAAQVHKLVLSLGCVVDQ